MDRRSTKFLLIACFVAPGLATAQTPAPALAANPMGPPLAGICLFGRDAAIANSKAGQATNARLVQLGTQVNAELAPETQALVTERDALNAGATTIPAAQRGPRIDALQKRAATFNQLQQLRTAQLQASRTQAIEQILKQMDPVLGPISTSRHCSVVFERSATYGFNPAMDITPAVIQQLDARLPTLTFNLAPPKA